MNFSQVMRALVIAVLAGLLAVSLLSLKRSSVARGVADPPSAGGQSVVPVAPTAAASAETPPVPPGPDYPKGLNYALESSGGSASGPPGSNAGKLIDGDDFSYTGGTGFGMTYWGKEPEQYFLVTLKEPSMIDTIRVLLWDRDERFYRYRLEICADEKGAQWKELAHVKPGEEQRSWQTNHFKAQFVKLIRLTGTFNSSNAGFHAVELQAFLAPANLKPAPRSEALEF